MDKYTFGKIYKITSSHCDDVYIGSTTLTLSTRFSIHSCHYNKWFRGDANYISSFEIMKYADAKIELIENFSCESRQQLVERERYHIEQNVCVNIRVPGRSAKEYCREYYENHREHIKTNVRNRYYEKGVVHEKCSCGSVITHAAMKAHLATKKHAQKLTLRLFDELPKDW